MCYNPTWLCYGVENKGVIMRGDEKWLAIDEKPLTGDELHEIRRFFGMTQSHVARLCGVTRQTISDWERGVAIVRPLPTRVLRSLRKRPMLIHLLYPEFAKWAAMAELLPAEALASPDDD
jgi:DNA-binding transcriptional regulator YiaG